MDTKSIKNLFKGKYFIIPHYQRGYAWGEKQLKDFWDDINQVDGGEHYTGVITLQNREGSEFNVVDGQQRLTTTIILINELLNYVKNDDLKELFIYDNKNKKYRFGYEEDTPSHQYFIKEVLGREKYARLPEESFYTNNLRKAKEFFAKQLQECKNPELILSTLIDGFIVNEYIINENFDINASFETMNNRGKHLSKLELLKNRFFYLIKFANLTDVERLNMEGIINECYNTIYGELGRNKDNCLNDDDFLQTHWYSYPDFKYKRSEAREFEKDLLQNTFTLKEFKKNTEEGVKKIESYITDLSQSSKYYYELHFPSNTKEELAIWLKRLNFLGFFSFKPLVMVALKKCGEAEVLNLLKMIEKFCFILFAFSGYSPQYRNNQIYQMAKDLQSNTINIEEIIKKLNEFLQSEEKILENNTLSLENFIRLSRITKGGKFYGWSHLKYLLLEYEYELSKASKHYKDSLFLYEEIKVDSIEHISPQQPKNEAQKQGFENYNKSIHLLGNLLLLKSPINSELSNEGFEVKKNRYETGYLSHREVCKEEIWNENKIFERGEKILAFASKRWEMNLSENAIKQIASLNFDAILLERALNKWR